ncbi:MAG: hypothetical protein U0573_03075 [Phycisphaerales bacterium]|nr:hypothetical protein [Planctomycetota bacterium]
MTRKPGDPRSFIPRLARAAHFSARGRRGPWAMLGVWFIVAVFGAGALGYFLAARTPAWFSASPASTDRETAQRLENRLITEAFRFRGAVHDGHTGEPWTVRITESEAAAWLAVKLPEWLKNRDVRLPQGISDLRAHFGSDRAWAGAMLDGCVFSLSARFDTSAGSLSLSSVWGGIGRLSLPLALGGWRLAGANALVPEDQARILTGRAPLLPGGTIRLEDGRRVRVLAVRLSEGLMEVDCITEAGS